MLKSCTCFQLVQIRKNGLGFFKFYLGKVKIQHCLNEGREGSTSKNSQHNKMKMKLQLVKALRPKQAFFRAYRTSSNHDESVFCFKILLFVLLFFFYFNSSIHAGPLDKGESWTFHQELGHQTAGSIIDQGFTQHVDEGAACVIGSLPGGSE